MTTLNQSTINKYNIAEFYNCRNCFNRLTSNDPASQYQKQKLIQNTVRVPSSLYTMNLGGLAGFKRPLNEGQYVEQFGSYYFVPENTYWNQQSDRPKPSIQNVKIASGSTYHSSSTKHSITRLRPGSMSPGGKGVDIKHNSYDRYLNRLKGKSALRRGPIRSFNAKNIKTNIIDGCNCNNSEINIYGNPQSSIQSNIYDVTYKFNIGDYVWVKKPFTDKYYKAVITDIINNNYYIRFIDDNNIYITTVNNLLIYYDCNYNQSLSTIEEILLNKTNNIDLDLETSKLCILTNLAANNSIL